MSRIINPCLPRENTWDDRCKIFSISQDVYVCMAESSWRRIVLTCAQISSSAREMLGPPLWCQWEAHSPLPGTMGLSDDKSPDKQGVCIIIDCQCCMKEQRRRTIPEFPSPYKFSTCFHWVLQYVPRMSRCVLGTVNSNKWRHGDNHGKSMIKRENNISLLAWVK